MYFLLLAFLFPPYISVYLNDDLHIYRLTVLASTLPSTSLLLNMTRVLCDSRGMFAFIWLHTFVHA